MSFMSALPFLLTAWLATPAQAVDLPEVAIDIDRVCTKGCGELARETWWDWSVRVQYARQGCETGDQLACRYLGMAMAEGLGGLRLQPELGIPLLVGACESGDRGACTVAWLHTRSSDLEPHLLLKPAEKTCKANGDGLGCLGNVLVRTDPEVKARRGTVVSPGYEDKGYIPGFASTKEQQRASEDRVRSCKADPELCPLVDPGSSLVIDAVHQARKRSSDFLHPAAPNRVLKELPIPDSGADCLADPASCRVAAEAYRRGNGVDQSDRMAAALWQDACFAGDGVSCAALAGALDEGYGVAVDPHRSLVLFEEACRRGHDASCALLKAEKGPEAKHIQDIQGCYREDDASACARLAKHLWRPPIPRVSGYARDQAGYADLLQRSCRLGDTGSCSTLEKYVRDVWVLDGDPPSHGTFLGHELSREGRECLAWGEFSTACVRFLGKHSDPATQAYRGWMCKKKGGRYCPKEPTGNKFFADALAIAGAVAGEVAPEMNTAGGAAAMAVGGQVATAAARSMGVSADVELIVQGIQSAGGEIRAYKAEIAMQEHQERAARRLADHTAATIAADPEGKAVQESEDYCRWGGHGGARIYWELDGDGRLVCDDGDDAVVIPKSFEGHGVTASCEHDAGGRYADRSGGEKYKHAAMCDRISMQYGEAWAKEPERLVHPPPPARESPPVNPDQHMNRTESPELVHPYE